MIRIRARLQRPGFELDVDVESDAGAIALFGPSGAGKSTVLGVVAGLLRPDAGRVEIDGQVLFDSERGIDLPTHRRRVGMVFQDSLLFRHLTVRENLVYGMRGRVAGLPGVTLDRVVDLLGIGHLAQRRPGGLSGGERQRVAIGRALLARPRLLLLDEPLASLDQARRQEILPYVSALHTELGVPFLYVSHAVEEVARLAQHVVLLRQGRVVASGAPSEILSADVPADARGGFDALSIVEAAVRAHDLEYRLTVLEHPAGSISVPGIVGRVGETWRVLVRATDVALALQRPREVSYRTVLSARVVGVEQDEGPVARVSMELRGGGRIAALVTRKSIDELGLDVGDDAFAIVKSISLDERALGFGRDQPSPPLRPQD